MDKNRITEWLRRDKYNNDQSADVSADLERVERGEPLDYVIGWSWFLDCRIGLENRPLIPRPETEFWVERVLAEIKRKNFPSIACLDIFAGSGCVGLAILKHCPNATVDFAEKERRFVEQIKMNVQKNGIAENRCRVIQSDVFEEIIGRYDFIFANPPYIPEGRKKELDRGVTEWEPEGALFAGDTGLSLILEFLNQVGEHLNQGGQVWLEFDTGQKEEIEKILEELGYASPSFYKDQYDRWRWVVFSK